MKAKSLKINKTMNTVGAEPDLAKQKDILTLQGDFNEFKVKNEQQHKSLDDRLDSLAIEAALNREEHADIFKRLDRIETVVEKTYNTLDSFVKTQIRFDHELVASRNMLDRHEKRISTLEKRV